MPGDFSVDFDLATLVNGELNEDFKKHYQDVISSLKEGEKGKVTMNVIIHRMPDMTTIVGVEYDIKTTKPKRRKSSVASVKVVEGQMQLMTDKPKEKLDNVTMFKNSK